MKSITKRVEFVDLKKKTISNGGRSLNQILSIIGFIIFTLIQSSSYAQTTCSETALPELPDVTITSITQETEYAPHCLVVGIIGKEIKFELRLPKDWKNEPPGDSGCAGQTVQDHLPAIRENGPPETAG